MGTHESVGRGNAPLRRRITCDVLARGRVCKGVATEIAPHEIFVQLSGTSLPRRGCNVVLQLRDAIDGEDIEVHGVIARMQHGEVDDRGIRRGIVVRIVEAPMEYHVLFDGPGAEDTTEVEILIDIGPALSGPDFEQAEDSPLVAADALTEPTDILHEDLPATREAATETVAVAPGSIGASDHDLPATRVLAEQDEDSPTFRDSPKREEDMVQESSRTNLDMPVSRDTGADALEQVSAAPTVASSSATNSARPANAIVVYEGNTLQDVYDLLEEIGARPQRARLSGPTAFQGWDQPPKMVIVDVQNALSLDIPPNLVHDGVTWIAVASSASAVIGRMLRSRGFHLLVRRPVHRDALEALLRHVLHRGADRREVPRSPLGIDARLQRGRWHWPVTCTVLELSATGCRVVTREDTPLLDLVSLRISRAVSGTRGIALCALVIRRSHDEESGEWVLALRFQEVPSKQRERLASLLTRATIGPTSAPTDSPIRRMRAWLSGFVAADADRIGDALEAASEAQCPESKPAPERRRIARSTFDGEVVALDETRSYVTAVLSGRDVSTLGMRVEPHPELSVGRRMMLAFYDRVSRGTIEVAAEVVRGDGAHGMAVRFLDMDAQSAARLGQLVDALPAVESLVPSTRPLVVARIVPEALLELRDEVDTSQTGPMPGTARAGQDAHPASVDSTTPSAALVVPTTAELREGPSIPQARPLRAGEAPDDSQRREATRRTARRRRRNRRGRRGIGA